MTPPLDIKILPQPDDLTCGPTALHAVYRYWEDAISLDRVIEEVHQLEAGGTLAVLLGIHALRRGYRARIYTYNLELFDPTWFTPEVGLAERLQLQREAKSGRRLQEATAAYLEFLRLGGELRFEELTPTLCRRLLEDGSPVLTGLSATYLYGSAREVMVDGQLRYDDIRGIPTGHFVVLSGWDGDRGRIQIADPLPVKPRFPGHHYNADVQRVLAAILLGALTYDANLLVVRP